MSTLVSKSKTDLDRSRARGALRGAAAQVQRYRVAGGFHTLKELGEALGVAPDTIYRRIRRLQQAGLPVTMEALGGRGIPA